MSTPLIILGTGGGVYDVIDTVNALAAAGAPWRLAGFLDDAKPTDEMHLGLPVIGRLSDARRLHGYQFINAIGSDASYAQRPDIIASTGLTPGWFATLVHPGASVSRYARLGRGVHVAFGAQVGGGAVVGDHANVGPRCCVGHDTTVGEYAMVAPGAVISGFCTIGRCAYVGSAAAVRQRTRIGENALVGMGAVVLKDVAASGVVVGNPARELERRSQRDFVKAVPA